MQDHHVYAVDVDNDDAARAAKLLGDPGIMTVSSGHLVHFERPRDYLRAIHQLDAATT